MTIYRRAGIFAAFALLVAAIAALCAAPAFADARTVDHGGSYFGSVVVEPGQTVDGDLNVLGGDATIEGTVDGDVNVVGGSVIARPGSTITGHVNQLGGDVASSIVPWAPSDMEPHNAFGSDFRILWRIAWDVVVLLVFLIFPVRTRMALGRLEQHPGLSVAVGLAGWVAVIPLAIMLAVTVILIPLIPVQFVALVVAIFIGKAALALLVGRRLFEMLSPATTPSPLGALVLGLALLTAAELVPVLGILVTILVALVGVGAVMLTFVAEQGPPGPLGSGKNPWWTIPRAPVSGPPMPTG